MNTYGDFTQQAFRMSDKEFDELERSLNRNVIKFDLQTYLKSVETLNRDIDMEDEMSNSDYVIFDMAEGDYDYSTPALTVSHVLDVVNYEVEAVYDPDVICETDEVQQDTRIIPVDEQVVSMVSVLEYVGLTSTKYNCKPHWSPYVRQNRFVSDMGDFVIDGKLVMIEFPNVGYEVFSDQFRNNLGVMTRSQEVVSVNNISHIVYSARPLNQGTEFIVFRTTCEKEIKYFLWDNLDIRQMEYDDGQTMFDGMCSGVKWNNKYYVYYNEKLTRIFPQGFEYVDHNYLTTALKNNNDMVGLVLNIDGADYVVPREKQVVLTKYNNCVVDKGNVMYIVDQFPMGNNGLYYVKKDFSFIYICDTMRPVDSTQVVYKMMNKVIDLDDFFENFLIPSSLGRGLEYISYKWLSVEIAKNKQEILDVLSKHKLPFMRRNADGSSKNSKAMKIAQTGRLYLDSYVAYSVSSEFFIGNIMYNSYRCVKPVIVITKRDKVLKVKYYSNSESGKYSRFKLKRVQYFNTGKQVDMGVRERKYRKIVVFSGELKDDFVKYCKGSKERARKENIPFFI